MLGDLPGAETVDPVAASAVNVDHVGEVHQSLDIAFELALVHRSVSDHAHAAGEEVLHRAPPQRHSSKNLQAVGSAMLDGIPNSVQDVIAVQVQDIELPRDEPGQGSLARTRCSAHEHQQRFPVARTTHQCLRLNS